MDTDRLQPSSGRQTSLFLVLPLATVALFTAAASWTLFAVVGVHLKQNLHLTETVFAALLAMPMLIGGLASLAMGLLARYMGGRRIILGCLGGLLVALTGFLYADSVAGFIFAGAGFGLAGGVFGAGVQYVARHSPRRRVGLNLGIYCAGITGAGFTYLVVPLVHSAYQWQVAPVGYIALTFLALMLLLTLTPPEPPARKLKRYPGSLRHLFRQPRVGYFCLLYAYLFGAFVALALWLPDYISAQYGLGLRQGALLSLLFTIPGALAQIPGGALADHLGADRVQRSTLLLSLIVLFMLSYPPTMMSVKGVHESLHFSLHLPLPAFLTLLTLLGVFLGLGKGAQLRLLFDDFPTQTGPVSGAMLSAGCLAASVLPLLFGLSNDYLGIRSAAFMMIFGLAAICTWIMERTLRNNERQRLLLHTDPQSL